MKPYAQDKPIKPFAPLYIGVVALLLIATALTLWGNPPVPPDSPRAMAAVGPPKRVNVNAWKATSLNQRTTTTFDAYGRLVGLRIWLTNLPPQWKLQESRDLKSWSGITGLTIWSTNNSQPFVLICPTNAIGFYRIAL